LAREMAVRRIVLCDADAAVGGGVIDFDIDVLCGDKIAELSVNAAGRARGGIVSNAVFLASLHGVLLAFVVVWATVGSLPISDAALVFCLPSSLLPAWTAVLPSTATSAAFLLSQIRNSACTVTDAVIAVLGVAMVVLPVAGVGVLMRASDALYCTHEAAQHSSHCATSAVLQWAQARLFWLIAREWRWAAAVATDASGWLERAAWVVLLEYRVLWYPVLDMTCLAVLSIIAVASGLGDDDACRGWTLAALGLLLAQLVVLVAVNPVTSRMSFAYNIAALLLTCLSIAAAATYMFVQSHTSTSGLWLVQGAAVCDLAIVGVSAFKMLQDVLKLFSSIYRRIEALTSSRRGLLDCSATPTFVNVADMALGMSTHSHGLGDADDDLQPTLMLAGGQDDDDDEHALNGLMTSGRMISGLAFATLTERTTSAIPNPSKSMS
jgi:hypothetical protein